MAPVVQLKCRCGDGYLRPSLSAEDSQRRVGGRYCVPDDHAPMTGEFEESEGLSYNCLIEPLNSSVIVKTSPCGVSYCHL